jgi:hypothetical protein
MKNFLIIFSILILTLTRCISSECEIVTISKEDKEWLIPYQKHKKLFFENQKGEFHIFITQKIDSSCTPCNRFEIGPNQYEQIYVSSFSNKVLNSPSGEQKYMSFSISANSKENSKSKKCINVYDFRKEFYEVDSKFILDTIFCPALNKEITAYYFTYGTGMNIKSIHYNKEYGVLQYVSEEDTFKLMKLE